MKTEKKPISATGVRASVPSLTSCSRPVTKNTSLTYKVQLIFGSDKAHDYWVQLMRSAKDCYNFASKIAFDEKLPFGMKPFHHRLYREEREKFRALPAQMCIKVNQLVLANYRTAKENKVELEKPLKMKRSAIGLDKRLYSRLTPESISLSTGDGKRRSEVKFLLYPKFRELAAKYKMCDPTLQYDEKHDEFALCVPFQVPISNPEEETYLAVDLGLRRSATLSDGTALTDKEYLARRRRLRHNKRIFQKHKKKSHSARSKLKKCRRKEFNDSKDFCHWLANTVLEHDGNVIVLEDLSKIKQTTAKTADGHKRTRHNNRMSQVPFYQFRQILTYKAPLRGKRVETVQPQYTSQEDCRNGSREGCKRQGCRFYTADGLVFDADWNATINICNRKHPVSFSLPLDGRLNLIGRHRQQANRGVRQHPASPPALAVGS